MKLNSSTFLCTLPYLGPISSSEDNTTSLSHTEEEKERLRARKKGWDLLRPLEGNCMYFVPPAPPNPFRQSCNLCAYVVEHGVVDIRLLPQPLRKTIPCPSPGEPSPFLPTRPRPHNRTLYPRPNPRQ